MPRTAFSLFWFAVASAALAFAQTPYQGLVAGTSTRDHVQRTLGAPVRQVSDVVFQHGPQQGTGPILAHYAAGTQVVERIEVAFVQPIVRSVLVSRVLGDQPPEARKTSLDKALLEFFGAPRFVALAYASGNDQQGATSIIYMSPDLYARTLGKPGLASAPAPSPGSAFVPAPGPALAPAATASPALAAETDFRVKLLSTINTASSRKGDRVTAQVISPEAFAGDFVEGQVREAKSSGKIKGEASLNFTFETLQHGRQSIPIRSSIKAVNNSQGKENVDEEGRILRKRNRTGAIAAAAGAGALLGALTGGGRGAAIGAGVGAASSLVVMQFATEGEHLAFAPGSEFVLSVRRRSE